MGSFVVQANSFAMDDVTRQAYNDASTVSYVLGASRCVKEDVTQPVNIDV